MALAKSSCNYCQLHGSQLLKEKCSTCQSELTVCRGKFVNIEGNYSDAFPIRFPWRMMTDLQTLLTICADYHTHHFLKDIKYMIHTLEARYSPNAEWVLLYIEEYGYLNNMFLSLISNPADNQTLQDFRIAMDTPLIQALTGVNYIPPLQHFTTRVDQYLYLLKDVNFKYKLHCTEYVFKIIISQIKQKVTTIPPTKTQKPKASRRIIF